jgi:hypothetical protein
MKKTTLLIVFMFLSFLLISCISEETEEETMDTIVETETETQITETPIEETVEEPDDAILSIEGLNGHGTLISPYLVTLNVGETLEKSLSIEGEVTELEYYLGTEVSNKFQTNESLNNVLVSHSSTLNRLIIVGQEVGKSILRVKAKGLSSSAYVEVNTIVRDGNIMGTKNYRNGVKILAIGNSFSEDSMTYLSEIANDYGMTNFIIGNMYIGGATLQTHYNSVVNLTTSHTYWKNENNTWVNKGAKSLLIGVLDEDWDIITFQQASGSSGIADTYQPFLDFLISYVKERKSSPTTFMWHQTWAYASTSNHSEFYKYESSQNYMYSAIVDTVISEIEHISDFRAIIPTGTAIQNVRTSKIGDNLTRDGFHLNNYGRYVAGLMWFRTITGFSIDNISYRPATVTEEMALIAKEAVNNAYQYKFVITNSNYNS